MAANCIAWTSLDGLDYFHDDDFDYLDDDHADFDDYECDYLNG
eukprot:CAMPEP_0198506498 /NCGR_PEP_ID=MMETSP1462-20131121/11731_1 /TAXON_ID=1333877 /ORGANISM="Brandtodinium nutriculum, Strain RCC3387" /LENGTH=42 /DNA_ID= /DNA_START= /DNA_END= /DNA_ORIENTATION=